MAGRGEYELVGAIETNAGGGRVSVAAPVGRALGGQRVGARLSVATPGGTLPLEVLSVLPANVQPQARKAARTDRHPLLVSVPSRHEASRPCSVAQATWRTRTVEMESQADGQTSLTRQRSGRRKGAIWLHRSFAVSTGRPTLKPPLAWRHGWQNGSPRGWFSRMWSKPNCRRTPGSVELAELRRHR